MAWHGIHVSSGAPIPAVMLCSSAIRNNIVPVCATDGIQVPKLTKVNALRAKKKKNAPNRAGVCIFG